MVQDIWIASFIPDSLCANETRSPTTWEDVLLSFSFEDLSAPCAHDVQKWTLLLDQKSKSAEPSPRINCSVPPNPGWLWWCLSRLKNDWEIYSIKVWSQSVPSLGPSLGSLNTQSEHPKSGNQSRLFNCANREAPLGPQDSSAPESEPWPWSCKETEGDRRVTGWGWKGNCGCYVNMEKIMQHMVKWFCGCSRFTTIDTLVRICEYWSREHVLDLLLTNRDLSTNCRWFYSVPIFQCTIEYSL